MITGWIDVDLDGTLAQYDGWKGVAHIGEPTDAEGFLPRACPARRHTDENSAPVTD